MHCNKGKNNMRWMGVCGWVGYGGVWECVAVGRDVAVWLGRLYHFLFLKQVFVTSDEIAAWVHHVGVQCVLRFYIAWWNIGSKRVAMIWYDESDLIADFIAIWLCSAIASLRV